MFWILESKLKIMKLRTEIDLIWNLKKKTGTRSPLINKNQVLFVINKKIIKTKPKPVEFF
jgi:hypothetical protein